MIFQFLRALSNRNKFGLAMLLGAVGMQTSVYAQSNAPTTLINIDFGTGTTSTKVGFAATGQTSSDFWNHYSRDDGHGGYKQFGAVAGLKYADGTFSSTGISVTNAAGAWGNGTSDPMYQSYLYPSSGGNISIGITNLAGGQYDIYVYGHAPADDGNSSYTLNADGMSSGSQSTAGPGWNSVVWQEGIQYVVFHGVQIAGSNQVSLIVSPQLSAYAIISGIQLAQVSGSTTPAAPAIVSQPASQTVWAGSNVTFTVAASGTAPLTYQWTFNSASIANATSSSLTLNNAQTSNAGNYAVAVSNSVGGIVSSTAVLTVNTPVPPSITSQPQSVAVSPGTPAGFSVTATGTAPLSYQWRLNGTNLVGATRSTLGFGSPQTTNSGTYSVLVSNLAGSLLSSNATLSVTGTAPAIVSQPVSRSVAVGNSVSFTAGATGTAPLRYHWKFNGTDLPGAISSILTLNNVQASNAGNYSVVVTNAFGSVQSSNATLTVTSTPPAIVSQPQNATVYAGATASFTVTASGTAPLSYQWSLNGSMLAGATQSSLVLNNVQTSDAGTYAVTVSNAAGTATSSNATLIVNIPQAPGTVYKLIDVDFDAGTTSSKVGLAATGQTTNDFWNLYTRDDGHGGYLSFGVLSDMKYADNSPSQAGLTVANAPGAWGNGTSDPMYQGYIYPFDGRNITVLVTNLDAGTYDIYVYGHGPANEQNSTYTLSVDGTSYGSQTTTGPGWNSVVWQEGAQYVLFRSVTVNNAASVVNLIVSPQASSYAILAGMQIAQVSTPTPTAPFIVTQPQSQTVIAGNNASLSVGVRGSSPLSYQWSLNGSNLAGAIQSTLTFSPAQPSDAGTYAVTVSNPLGSVTSSNATLAVNVIAPAIVTQPASQAVLVGANVTFSVAASGSGPLSYQWSFNGANLAGATASVLALSNVQTANAGTYSVMVGNTAGSVASSNATLTVNVPQPPLQVSRLIDVDFDVGTVSGKIGYAAAGQSSNDFWNLYSRDDGHGGYLSFGVLPNLKFADGSFSQAGLTVANAPGAWGNGTSDPMYQGYLYPFDGGNIAVVVTNLDAGTYDIYLYGHAPGNDGNSTYALNTGGVNYGSQSTAGPGWNSVVWQEGVQYVVFRAVAISSPGQTVTITVSPQASSYAVIAGMQIAQVNAPTPTAPTIITQPQSQAAQVGDNVSFSVGVNGTSPLSYQWQLNGTGILGATSAILTLANVQLTSSGNYSVTVANAAGSATSSNAVLTVTPLNHAPVANAQNIAINENASTPITLSGSDADGNALTYTVVTQTAHGTLSGVAPNLTYQPVSNYAGGDSFTFKVNDGQLDSAAATVSIVVRQDGSRPLIDVDFDSGTSSAKTGFAATGQTANDFWNLYSRDDGHGGYLTLGGVKNLKFADGSISGAGLMVANAPGAWGNGTSDPMYAGYLYPFDGGNITVAVTNLDVGTYDLYVYGHAPGDNGNSTYQLNVEGVNYGSHATAQAGWNSVVWQEGVQYVVFRGVAITNSAQMATITVLPGASGYAILAGMQIASVTATNLVPVNHVPVANEQSVSIVEGGSVAITLHGSDADGDPLTYSLTGLPTHGTLTGIAPNLTYQAASNYSGADSFTFKVNDGKVDSTPALVNIFVQQSGALPLVDVDFGAGTATGKAGFAATGQATNDFWNFYSRDDGQGGWRTFGSLANLKYSDGTASTIGMSIANAPGFWSAGSSDPMFDGYIYPLDGGSASVMTTNLPPGQYDLYVYGIDSSYQLNVDAATYGTKTLTNALIVNPVAWQEGAQYVIFRGVQITSSSQIATLTVNPGAAGYAIISGLQIAQVSTNTTSGNVSSGTNTPTAKIVVSPLVTLPNEIEQFVFTGNGSNAIVVLDGSLSTDPTNAPLQYSWLEDSTTPLQPGVTTTNVLTLGLHEVTLTVDNGNSMGKSSVIVEVVNPIMGVSELVEVVSRSGLSEKTKRPLVDILVLAYLPLPGNPNGFDPGKLVDFQNKVTANVAPINPALADSWINFAQHVIDAYNNP